MMPSLLRSVTLLAIMIATAGAQAPKEATPPAAAGYTPPPISTTYRPLTGKLFFTDLERDRLDKARIDGVQIVEGDVVVAVRSPNIEGFVRSSGGRTTYWVNGSQRIVAKPSQNLAPSPLMTGGEPAVKFQETGARKDSTALPKSDLPPRKKSSPRNVRGSQNP